jgi:RNA polymerase sigma factor (sigma-70 family)
MDRSVHELRDAFFQLLDRGESAETPLWHEVWRLFLEHPWYLDELSQTAHRVVRKNHAPLQWAEDIAQEATLLFRLHLRRAVDLHVNRELAHDHFAGWLGRIIARDCSRALRAMRRAQRRAGGRQVDVEAVAPRGLPMDEIIDLGLAISKLADEPRRVVLCRLRGCGIAEISKSLQISQTHVHRMLQRALAQFERRRPENAG